MAAHVANINDSETHSDEDESDGGLDDLLGISSLDCASESEEDEAPLFARRDADLGALLDADRYFAVVDGAVDADALASALEDLEAVHVRQLVVHQDNIKRLSRGEVERVRTQGLGHQLVSRALEHTLDGAQDQRVVVYHQDAGHGVLSGRRCRVAYRLG